MTVLAAKHFLHRSHITEFRVLELLVAIKMWTTPDPDLSRHDSEKWFKDPRKQGSKLPFPSLSDPPSLDLSVIVPAYNEEERLPAMMDEAMGYLEERQKNNPSFSFEVIVVDDGSKDTTTETALKYSERFGVDKVRVLTFEQNRGKGGAVRLGMMSGRGRQLLFADADGASRFADLDKLQAELAHINTEENLAVVCGSRAHLEKDSIAQRSLFRTLLMKGFHFLVWSLCVRGIKDTQCGFKLLTRPTAQLLFSNLHVNRWAFDVDLLYLAQHFHIPIGEVAIVWHEIEGTKMVPVWSWLQMGRDLVLISLRYKLGFWNIHHKTL
ncbi:LOW QUALITY PROTEIN: dolichyl-phosphate beta-glucosyltransferase-like [Babylonia areolata]|uniref:LOW QUALITY PROTEIN: dolichyl-phosphate beta-glucosyltransferase-like n=1 Tax=Babylonia areolata TaxID=304850 RepID=UPI003FD3294F